MNGYKYRIDRTENQHGRPSYAENLKPYNVVARIGGSPGSADNRLTTRYADVDEVEAMLHGLTLPQFVRDVRAFHERFKVPMPAKPTGLGDEDYKFRFQFMTEELIEFADAWKYEDHSKMLDALVDLVYVAIGTALWAGWDFEEAWRRVHAANMRKMPAQSADASKRGHALDVVKPEGWAAPDLSDLVK